MIKEGAARLAMWRHDLHDEMTQMRELGIHISERAFAMCFVANPADYEGMSNSEAVDLIIQQASI